MNMKETGRIFWKKVFFTTFAAFFFVTMAFLGLTALTSGGTGGAPTTLFQVIGYLALKLYLCILPFSFCLGLSARIFDGNKPRALKRLLHFLACFVAYVIFMDLIFTNTNAFLFSDATSNANLADYIMKTIPFFLGYPVTAAVTALGRAVLTPKVEKEFKSILD